MHHRPSSCSISSFFFTPVRAISGAAFIIGLSICLDLLYYILYSPQHSKPGSFITYYCKMTMKTIVVFGATGKQGGSVVTSLLDDGVFHVKAVTRDPAKDNSKALASKGAEVVQV